MEVQSFTQATFACKGVFGIYVQGFLRAVPMSTPEGPLESPDTYPDSPCLNPAKWMGLQRREACKNIHGISLFTHIHMEILGSKERRLQDSGFFPVHGLG